MPRRLSGSEAEIAEPANGVPTVGTRRAPGRGEIARLLRQHGLHPSKALGQHFVTDPNTVERIARLARVGPGDRVLEIGAGLGSLTIALAATGALVTAVEVDHGIVPVLRQLVEPLGVSVVEADAMSCDWAVLLAGAPHWVLVANLPYNVATPLVLDLLRDVPSIGRMLVLVQREAGDRLVAAPGASGFGAVSVRVGYFATATLVGRVPPGVFLPRPNVESVLVELVRREFPAVDPAMASYAEIDLLLRAGFAGRRKMLRRSLEGLVDASVFSAAGIDGRSRAEELGIEDWGKLVACRRSIACGHPRS
ncbi:MAG TPA: 16S rRNA (adenine(1518)-N(6)/adenine(1519)-N(6))-dimethyltransferase RsmA [Acidimicrobiales bacterium]|nr:16S rRNA (adenine(1518)-N(6)/adenine(1519)-N(6))-dimethyltransferase RsmA [Acidimicrobiales bacterium]